MHLRTTSPLSHILQLNLAIPILHLSHHITSLPQTSNPPHLQILTTFDDVLYCTVPITTKLFIFSEMESRDTLPAAGLVRQLVWATRGQLGQGEAGPSPSSLERRSLELIFVHYQAYGAGLLTEIWSIQLKKRRERPCLLCLYCDLL